jgi:hypothetical protein
MEMINFGFLTGWAIAIATFVLVGLLTRHLLKKNIPEDSKDTALKYWGLSFSSLSAILVVSFVITFMLFGWRSAPIHGEPQGGLDTTETTGQLGLQEGENSPRGKGDRLKEGDAIQKQGMEDLQDFRSKVLKKEKE